MGGVDLIRRIIGRQKILLRSQRLTIRMFYHFFDLIMSTFSLLYKYLNEEKKKTEMMLNSADFCLGVTETLCKINTKSKASRKRKIGINIKHSEKKSIEALLGIFHPNKCIQMKLVTGKIRQKKDSIVNTPNIKALHKLSTKMLCGPLLQQNKKKFHKFSCELKS